MRALSVKPFKGTHDTVDPPILRAWTEHFGDHKVFPMLQDLSVEWATEVGAALVLGLAGTSLESICLEFETSYEKVAPEVDDMLRHLFDVSPNIYHLTLTQHRRAGPLGGPLFAIILKWRHMQSVCLNGIPATDELLNALSSLVNLHTLRLQSCLQNPPATRHRFASLLNLELGRCNLGTAKKFISELDSPRLHSVAISSTSPDSGLVGMTRALSKHVQLKEIHITQFGRAPQIGCRHGSVKLLEPLSPLLSLPRMRRLSLSLCPIWGEGSEAITAIAQAWPDLETLVFGGAQHITISFHALTLLLGNCPNLRTLGVPVNISSTLPPMGSLNSPPNRLLASLCFAAAGKPEGLLVEPLAEFLHAACPLVQCRVLRHAYRRQVSDLPEVARLQTLLDSFKS